MSKWKLQIKNKIEDANIEEPVRSLASHPEDEISGPAKQVSRNALLDRIT